MRILLLSTAFLASCSTVGPPIGFGDDGSEVEIEKPFVFECVDGCFYDAPDVFLNDGTGLFYNEAP